MASTSQQTQHRLEAIRERTRNARDRRAAARKAQQAARQADDVQAFQTATEEFNDAQAELEVAQQLESVTLRQLAGHAPDFGNALAHNPQALETLSEIASTQAGLRSNVMVGPVLSLDDTLALFGRALSGPFAAPVNLPDTTGRSSGFDGIAEQPVPRLSLLDFWPSKPVDNKTLDYLRRSGVPAAVDPTAEGAVKPEVVPTYTSEEAQAETFAGWAKLLRQQIDDVDELMPDVQAVIRYAVLRGVEKALVDGNVAFSMDGIQTVSGALSPDLTGVTNLADAVALTLSELRTSGVEPTFVAVSPADYTDEVIRKNANGDYIGAIENGRFRSDPTPVVQSTALAAGEIVAGDAPQAGYIGVRQPPVLLVGTESDDLIRNRVTAVVEMRAVPVIKVPSALAVATFVGA